MSLHTHSVACEICYPGADESEPVHISPEKDGHEARVHFSPTGEVHIRIGKLTLIERSNRNGPSWTCEHGHVTATRATAREALEAVKP